MKLPRISIITPSFNQGQYIEETICSVLDQNYPDLEYIIIDGGSTDDTVEIIKKYESQITYWVSEKDRGQAHAINKGLTRASGDIIAYINSDDYYLPGAFNRVAETFLKNPVAGLIHGVCRCVNERGEKIGEQKASITKYEEIVDLWDVWWQKKNFVQPEVFWTRATMDEVGLFNEALFYVMDYEYWLRILKNKRAVAAMDCEVACFRRTETQKSTQSNKVADELLEVVYPYYLHGELIPPARRRVLLGNLIFQKFFQTKIEESLKSKDSTLGRWLKLSGVILENPAILFSPLFKKKIYSYLN